MARSSTATSSSWGVSGRSWPPRALTEAVSASASGQSGPVGPGQPPGDGFRLATQSGEAVFVDDGAVVEDVENLVLAGTRPDLGHEDLHLQGFHFMGEDVAHVAGVEVGQRAGVDVLPAELVTLDVGVLDPGHPQLVELVVLADAGEGDPVVDLADLVERTRGFSEQMSTPPAYTVATRGRPRAMFLRAKSALSFMNCSGAT